jgi:hypothetical protein
MSEAARLHRRSWCDRAGWTRIARAQDKQPVIGFLHVGSAKENTKRVAAFWKGLGETGFVEGQNVAAEYRWADGREDRLESMAADLVRRDVAVIATCRHGHRREEGDEHYSYCLRLGRRSRGCGARRQSQAAGGNKQLGRALAQSRLINC